MLYPKDTSSGHATVDMNHRRHGKQTKKKKEKKRKEERN